MRSSSLRWTSSKTKAVNRVGTTGLGAAAAGSPGISDWADGRAAGLGAAPPSMANCEMYCVLARSVS